MNYFWSLQTGASEASAVADGDTVTVGGQPELPSSDSLMQSVDNFYQSQARQIYNYFHVRPPVATNSRPTINPKPTDKPNMTDPLKLEKRRGILKCKAEAEANGAVTKVNAILDTAAGRSVVPKGSTLLLEGKAKSKALKRLEWTEDVQLWNAAAQGHPIQVKTLHGTKAASSIGVTKIRLNGKWSTVLAIIAPQGALPADTDILVDADTLASASWT